MNAAEAWQCECGETYDNEDDAVECCQPRTRQVWSCGECDAVHNEKAAAIACCADDAEHNGEPISPDVYQWRVAQLEAAGQRRLIP